MQLSDHGPNGLQVYAKFCIMVALQDFGTLRGSHMSLGPALGWSWASLKEISAVPNTPGSPNAFASSTLILQMTSHIMLTAEPLPTTK